MLTINSTNLYCKKIYTFFYHFYHFDGKKKYKQKKKFFKILVPFFMPFRKYATLNFITPKKIPS